MCRKILLYLFCFLSSLSIHAQSDDAMVLVFERAYPWSLDDIYLQFEGNVNVTIDWGGGEIEMADSAGTYVHSPNLENGESVDTVRIIGNLTHFQCNNWQTSLRKVLAWGNLGLTDLSQAFANARYLTSVPDSIPEGVTNLNGMFMNAKVFIGDISSWDVSNVTDMSYMFYQAYDFNSDISGWDVSNVTDMSYMFCYASDFNSDISSWDISHVTDVSYLFYQANAFEGDISSWNFSSVTNMSGFFVGWDWSGYDLSSLDVSRVTNMHGMFAGCNLTGNDISRWDVSGVTDMSDIFVGCDLADNDLSHWDVSHVTDMSSAFTSATNFESIDNWDVSGVINMRGIFAFIDNVDLDLSNWNVSSVTNMSRMFEYTNNVKVGLNSWDVSHVTNMDSMFFSVRGFETDISSWNVSNVTSMNSMFHFTQDFDPDLSLWDVSNVKNMRYMFRECTLSKENYSNMLVKWSELSLQRDVVFDGGLSQFTIDGYVARQKIIDTYGWTITDRGGDMPYPYLSPELEDSVVTLRWYVLESNDSLFIVQRRYKEGDEYSYWQELKSIASDFGTVAYTYIDDELPSADEVSYTVKSIDKEGFFEYSDTVTIDISTITGIKGEEEVPTEFVLMQNYPNPFNPTTSIEYSVASTENVTLKVYDMLGGEVVTLINETKLPGKYKITFDASGLASGVYFYRLTTDNITSTKKMVVLK